MAQGIPHELAALEAAFGLGVPAPSPAAAEPAAVVHH